MPSLRRKSPLEVLLQQRIPTVLGLLVLIIGVVAGVLLVRDDTGGFLPRASIDATPKQVRITNISDRGFTVSFITDEASSGFLRYGTEPGRMNTQVRDDRDQLTGSATPYQTHHITVSGLQPTTQYYFTLGTTTQSSFDNNGQPFSIRTARREDSTTEARTAYGEVRTEVGNAAEGAIVYISIQGASPVSTLVKSDGSWAIPSLAQVRTLDLSALHPLVDTDTVRVQVQGLRSSDILDTATTVGELSPLAPLRFGQVADVVTSATPLPTVVPEATTESPAPTTSGGAPGFNSLFTAEEASQSAPTSVEIRLEDQEVVNTTQPEFQGRAPAGAVLQIEVHSENQFFDVVNTDASGNWQWSVPDDLEPGEHTVTVTYTDENGQQQQISRTFLVQANTGLPSFTSTPSGSLATPTPVPTAMPTVAPTAIPTVAPIVTATATPRVNVPATSSAQPVSGGTRATFMMLGLSGIFFVVGAGSMTLLQRKGDSYE